MRKKLSFFLLCTLCAVFLAYGTAAYAAYDKPYVGDMATYTARYEDTLVHIARDYGLGYVEIRSANPGVDPWIPGKDREITLPLRHLLPDSPHEGIVINLPEMRLYAYVNKEKAPVTYPLGIGRDGLETPTGQTSIVRKVAGPSWRPTERMRKEKPELPEIVPAGPENPLGTHALYLGWPEYAVHGTNRPFGIGRRVSSGCIRLYPEDIKSLYQKIEPGTPVYVVDQPVKAAWIEGTLYIEAHADMAQAQEMEETGQISTTSLFDSDLARIMKSAGKDESLVDWALVRNVIRERKGYPVAVAHRTQEKTPEPANASADEPASEEDKKI